MNPRQKIWLDMAADGMEVLRFCKAALAWRKRLPKQRKKAEEKHRKKAERQLSRLLRQERHRQSRKIAGKWAKIGGRVLVAIRKKYF